MRVLIIKMSSLGDVVHTLPAITDACNNIPGIKFDWVVEEAFAEIPAWHPGVDKVIPIAWRRWRKSLRHATTRQQILTFWKDLRTRHYDIVLDAQGLLKSALVTYIARGQSWGLDRKSARESLASLSYHHKVNVPKNLHAIIRLRELFAKSLGYGIPHSEIEYGIDRNRWASDKIKKPYVVFLHGTTWTTKLWPEQYWRELCQLADNDNIEVHLPWGNTDEYQRALRIASGQGNAWVLDRLNLSDMVKVLTNAKSVIGVDSGLSHVAAAIGVPLVSIYGATNPKRTGTLGTKVSTLSSDFHCSPCLSKTCYSMIDSLDYPPCYQEMTPTLVWHSASNLASNHE